MLGVALRDTGHSLRDVMALARSADDAGYESIWFPEVGSRDAIALACMAGTETKRSTLGTGVVPLYSRNPVALALAAATASEACRGRFVLGLGAGHRFTAEMWYGAAWHRPRARLRETITVLGRILAGERVTHSGELRVDGFHLGSVPPPVPIYIGALTPPSLRLAGEVADGAILNWMPPEGTERCALVAREAAADAGRAVRVIAYVRAAVVADPQDEPLARIALRDQTYSYASLPAYASSLRNCGLGGALDRMASGDDSGLDELTEALCPCGDADAVRDRLAAYTKAGLDSVVVYPVPYGEDPVASVLRTIRSLA